MEDFEKNLRDKFKDATSNEGIDANDLWNSIATEITDDNPGTPPIDSSSNGIKKWLPLLLLLLIALSGLVFFQYNKSTTALNNSKNQNSIIRKTIENKTSENTSTNPLENTFDKNLDNTQENSSKNQINQNSKAINDTTKVGVATSKSGSTDKLDRTNTSNKNGANNLTAEDNLKNESSSNLNQLPSSTLNNQRFEVKPPENLIEIKKMDVAYNQQIQKFAQPADSNNSILAIDAISKQTTGESDLNTSTTLTTENILEVKSVFENFDLLSSKAITYPLEMTDEKVTTFKASEMKFDKSKAKFSIGLYGGAHLLGEKFAGDQASEIERAEVLNQAFKVFPGQHFGAEFYFHFNDHLFASAGVSYRRSISQFNKIFENKDSSIVREDEFAGQIISATATRTVVHHNKLTSISLPISIGYQTTFGKWGLGTSAGIMVNLTQKYSGRTLTERNQLINYPDFENKAIPTKDIYLSYQLNPFLNYSMNDKLTIQLRTEIGLHQFGKTELYNLKHSAWSSGIGLGFIYTP